MLHREDKWWKQMGKVSYREWNEPFKVGIGTYVVKFLLIFVGEIVSWSFGVKDPNKMKKSDYTK